MSAKISFCTPNYNDSETLEKYAESIMTQDWPNKELIIVDDGSTDNSKEVLKKLEEKYKENFKVIYLEKNGGACHARNEAAKHATGKYISFLPADAVLFPGMARIWVDKLEENPDKDFLYGGYRFVNEKNGDRMDYLGDAFDPYILETANYIDGSFPLKKELFDKMGGWDESIKSLQDWDFWLTAVKKFGAKALYIPDIFFETAFPHAGGLSFDSHANWLERTNQIKKKHGIPEREICVTGQGARFHAKNIAKMLGADYKDYPSQKPHNYKMIYVVGFFGNVAQAFFETDALRVVHWIGSDILALQQTAELNAEGKPHRANFINWLKHNVDIHLTEFEHTQKELEALGIKSRLCPLPPKKMFEPMELPKKFTVAVYDPYNNKAHYYPDLVKGLAAEMTAIDWKFFGDSTLMGKKDNIEHVGAIDDIGAFIKDTSCLLRVSKHDGLPISVMEWATAGRQIVTNVPGIVGAIQCEAEKSSLKKAILAAKKKKAELNMESANYYKELANHDKYREFIHGLMKYEPKEYWDNRAKAWHNLEGKHRDSKEEYIINKELDDLLKGIENPKVLDLGCGDGRWTDLLSQVNRGYLGVDISQELIGYAKEKFPKQEFKVLDMRNIDQELAGQKFDVIFSYTSLLHIPPAELKDTIEKLKKVGKYLLCIEPTKKPNLKGVQSRSLHPEIMKALDEGKLIYGIRSSFSHDYNSVLNIKKIINFDSRSLMVAEL